MISKGDLVLRWLEYNELILHMPILKEFLRNTFCHPHWESESICNLSLHKKYWINLIRFLRNLSSLVENNSKYFFFHSLKTFYRLQAEIPVYSLQMVIFLKEKTFPTCTILFLFLFTTKVLKVGVKSGRLCSFVLKSFIQNDHLIKSMVWNEGTCIWDQFTTKRWNLVIMHR